MNSISGSSKSTFLGILSVDVNDSKIDAISFFKLFLAIILSINPFSKKFSEVKSISLLSIEVFPISFLENIPIIAPGSAIFMSAEIAKELYTCPPDGFVSNAIWGSFLSFSSSVAFVVLIIWIREKIPSWTLLPPLEITDKTGKEFFLEYEKALEIFSPTIIPIDPPRKPKSSNIITLFMPPILQVPVTTASSRPVLSLVFLTFFL